MGRRRDQKRAPRVTVTRHRWPPAVVPAVLLAVVFAVKLAVIAQLQDHPLIQPEGGVDSAAYVRLARDVLGGNVALGPGLYYLSPLYIYFLAAGLWITESFAAVRGLQAALGTAAVGCVFVAAHIWFGRRAAWIAGAVAALTGVFTFYEILILQSSLDTFLTAAALACLAVALTDGWRDNRVPLIGAGVLFGLQTLNRPNVAIAAIGVAIGLLAIRRYRAAGWLIAGMALAVSPVIARNAVVSHQFALSSSHGGLNFYIGNHAEATGQYVAIPGVTGNIDGQAQDTRRVAETALGRPLTDAEVSSYFVDRALDWMRAHPTRALKLFARKLALTVNARHQWLDFSYPYYAYDTGSALRFLFVGPWLLVPLGVAGLVAGSSRVAPAHRNAYVAWAAFVPLYAVAVAVFFVAERYRLPMFVPLCIGSGAALDALLRRSMNVGALAAGAFGAVIAFWPLHVPDGRFEERLRLSKVLMNRHDYGAAAIELERAHELRPSDTTAEFNLGMALVSSGRAEEGLQHVKQAVAGGVEMPGARYALASTMLATGDREGAVALLRSYFPEPADSADSCFQVGLLALDAGAPRVAERYLQRALQLRPGWPEALEAISRIPR